MARKKNKPAPGGATSSSPYKPAGRLPRLVVFDLDYTLWPFWVDTHVTPPLKPHRPSGSSSSDPVVEAHDRYGDSLAFYRDVPSVLRGLRAAGVSVGVASRTSAPDLARELLGILHVPAEAAPSEAAAMLAEGKKKVDSDDDDDEDDSDGLDDGLRDPVRAIDVFDGPMEIYPGSKLRHFREMHRRTGIPYEEMLFFDDESRNRETESLGVTMRLVQDGVTWVEVRKGIEEWRRRRGVTARPSADDHTEHEEL